MSVKTKQSLKNFDGSVFNDVNKKEVSINDVFIQVFNSRKVSDPSLAWDIAKKFAATDDATLTPEEIKFISEELTSAYQEGLIPALFAGQVMDLVGA